MNTKTFIILDDNTPKKKTTKKTAKKQPPSPPAPQPPSPPAPEPMNDPDTTIITTTIKTPSQKPPSVQPATPPAPQPAVNPPPKAISTIKPTNIPKGSIDIEKSIKDLENKIQNTINDIATTKKNKEGNSVKIREMKSKNDPMVKSIQKWLEEDFRLKNRGGVSATQKEENWRENITKAMAEIWNNDQQTKNNMEALKSNENYIKNAETKLEALRKVSKKLQETIEQDEKSRREAEKSQKEIESQIESLKKKKIGVEETRKRKREELLQRASAVLGSSQSVSVVADANTSITRENFIGRKFLSQEMNKIEWSDDWNIEGWNVGFFKPKAILPNDKPNSKSIALFQFKDENYGENCNGLILFYIYGDPNPIVICGNTIDEEALIDQYYSALAVELLADQTFLMNNVFEENPNVWIQIEGTDNYIAEGGQFALLNQDSKDIELIKILPSRLNRINALKIDANAPTKTIAEIKTFFDSGMPFSQDSYEGIEDLSNRLFRNLPIKALSGLKQYNIA